jgi:hypothetical protein
MAKVCNRCQAPVSAERAERGYDGELYHPRHTPLLATRTGARTDG